jgi:hypothetical protein
MAIIPRLDYLCDYCIEKHIRVEGDTVAVLVPGKGIQEIELCEPDQESLRYTEVVELASHAGRDPKKIEDYAPKKRRRKAKKTQAGVEAEEAAEEAVEPSSEPESEGKRRPRMDVPIECKVEGCTTKRPLKNRTSFGVHLRQRHDTNLTEYEKQFGAAS